MKKSTVVIYSLLVFLISLFLFKSIFSALIASLLFALSIGVTNLLWEIVNLPGFVSIIKPIITIVLSSLLGLSLYIIIYLPVDFLVTEVWYITAEIYPWVAVVFLLACILIIYFSKWQKKIKNKNNYFLLVLYLFICHLFYLGYRGKKLKLEYLPKIYKLSSNWAIQGMTFNIEGRNFYPAWKPGRVEAGKESLNIVEWSENKIELEMPVPSEFGNKSIKVIRIDGMVSNQLPFEIKDPSFLIKDNL